MDTYSARKCNISVIRWEDANEFISSHHRDGAVRVDTAVVCLGLFYDLELVAVAQFCTPRTAAKKREYSTEWVRLAFKTGTRVVGGASKLFKHYITTYNPGDVFTYQDTTGDVTDVYLHCGMKLVSEDAQKQYLVAPGYTLESASRKEALGISYATRYGPDRILGTNLGEIWHANGTRKSNIEIFIEDLGWHIEETSGDRVYEWVDPNRTYYTYKITASDSPKYYFGVSHVKWANATLDECLGDGYFGSGGTKFQNWFLRHQESISKEVLGTFSRKGAAYQEEHRLVGNRYDKDPLCLNSTVGGTHQPHVLGWINNYVLRHCDQHGEVWHNGTSCMTCSARQSIKIRTCDTHGETKFKGTRCIRCVAAEIISVRHCATHGDTIFRGDLCVTCTIHSTIQSRKCELHGDVIHFGNTCMRCSAVDSFWNGNCIVHGDTMFRGDSCMSCLANEMITVQTCSTHGETKFRGDSCYRCYSESRHKLKKCELHGYVTHSGNSCLSCTAMEMITIDNCDTHGKTKFRSGGCAKCAVSGRDSLKYCDVHGMTKFNGDSCFKCSNTKARFTDICEFHGEASFTRSGGCSRCRSERMYTIQECTTHGETRFKGPSCIACARDAREARRASV